MSECTHDCSTCGEACASRQEPQSFLKELLAIAEIQSVFTPGVGLPGQFPEEADL